MNSFIEFFKTIYFLVVMTLSVVLFLWVQTEFESILKRRSIVRFSFLCTHIFRKIFLENGLFSSYFFSNLIELIRMLILLFSFMLFPYSGVLNFEGREIILTLIEFDNSLFVLVMLLLVYSLLGYFSEKDEGDFSKKIFFLFLLMTSFSIQSLKPDLLNYMFKQNELLSLGIRNYFIFRNPIGFFALFKLIEVELRNSNEDFSFLNILLLNSYIFLLIYAFLGGVFGPSSLENISSPYLKLFFEFISFFAKYIFLLVVIWVYRFVFVKRRQELFLADF